MGAAKEITAVGIAGAGFMGTGIAECAASAGIAVTLFDADQSALERSRKGIEGAMSRSVEKGRRDRAEAEEILSRMTWSASLDALEASELVLEAIVEDVDAKVELFGRLEGLLGPEAILASNTSSIPIAELAGATTRPDRVLGLHFFSPVPRMPLVELVVSLDTSRQTVADAAGFAEAIGKQVIETKDRSGFVVNFLLVPYLMAAIRMYEDGFATREDIDAGMQLGCGHPMGPLALCDLIGLDVLYSVCDSLFDEFKRDEYAPPPLMKRMVVSGRIGRKAGRGFYDYSD